MIDTLYTNGVIAVREKQLLGERLLRLAEMTAGDAFRALLESGFGSGAEGVRTPADAELLCAAEETALDNFIREYAPSKAILSYLLSPRDFHNAKALCKAEKLHIGAENMLAPEGLMPVAAISQHIKEGAHEALGKELGGAVKEVLEAEEITGAEIGAIFDKALYVYLFSACGAHGVLKRLLVGRVDRINVLTALRAADGEYAKKLYLGGGKLKKATLAGIFDADREKAAQALNGTPYQEFYRLCFETKEKGLPFTQAERELESFEADFFAERRYELERKEPFLYYVFRRRAEIGNVRILLVCLNAGLKEQEIKKRLRAI